MTGTRGVARPAATCRCRCRCFTYFMHDTPLGHDKQPGAWRRNVTGAFRAPATVFWNIGKA